MRLGHPTALRHDRDDRSFALVLNQVRKIDVAVLPQDPLDGADRRLVLEHATQVKHPVPLLSA
jgi:hypothetical protein